jgi:glutathione synthase/RimK-type ligase-like ATP-grasp enzyme
VIRSTPTSSSPARGVPAPRTVRLRTNSRDAVRAAIEAVGGLPAIFKVMGGEGGVGVARVDSWPSAYSVADLATSRASTVFVREFVPDALHWRLVVVADRVVAAYPNPTKDDDFRSRAPTDADDYRREPPPAAVEVAVRAVATLDVDLGGVDVLVTQDGRALVLEVNFPCFFAQAEIRAGVDVGGPIVDALLRSSKPG